MGAVRDLMIRRRAQGGTAAPPFVAPGTGSDAARLASLQQGAVQSLRQQAESEIRKAQAAFKEARGVNWTAFINAPLFILSKFADYRRWKPISELIDQAEQSLAAGDAAQAEDDKRRSYSSAWMTARLAQGAILREAGDGKTGVLDILKEESTQAGVDPERVKEAARDVGKTLSSAAQGAGDVVKVIGVGLGLYAAAKIVGGLRG